MKTLENEQKTTYFQALQSAADHVPASKFREDLILKTHPVRIVNDVINKVNRDPLNAAYKTRGSSSYHPQMLLKVLVCGYVSNVYSSRKLEAACKESSMSYPDHVDIF